MRLTEFNNYISRFDEVGGWCAKQSVQVIKELMISQSRTGDVLEIGLHEGKLFIPLCLCLRDGEQAVGVDVFEDQHLNIDKSGLGNRQVFDNNLQKFCPDTNISIIKADSTTLTTKYMLDNYDQMRFVSIDGGHTRKVVLSDARLAMSILKPGGIIAFDDLYRTDWSGVTAALADYYKYDHDDNPMYPIVVDSHKLFVTNDFEKSMYYRQVIRSSFPTKINNQFGLQEVFGGDAILLDL